MKTNFLIVMALAFLSGMFVQAQETNDMVVGKLEHEKVVLTKVVGLVDYFRQGVNADLSDN